MRIPFSSPVNFFLFLMHEEFLNDEIYIHTNAQLRNNYL